MSPTCCCREGRRQTRRRAGAPILLAALTLAGWIKGCGMSPEEQRAHDALVALDQQARELIAADRVSESILVELMADPDLMRAGETVFRRDCAVCHGDHGEGGIGPNLTDDSWLHGPQLTDMYDIVRLGRPTHGMRAWENKLQPAELLTVTAYAGSLLGSDPVNGKEPQGEPAVRQPPWPEQPGQRLGQLRTQTLADLRFHHATPRGSRLLARCLAPVEENMDSSVVGRHTSTTSHSGGSAPSMLR